jgi:N-acetylated-alpha-linked acidic dipeptidase
MCLVCAAALADPPSPPTDFGPIGFLKSSRAAQAHAEEFALAVPTPEKARAWLRALTEEPHVAGTPADRNTANDLRDKLRSWGWDAEIAEYEVLLNYPVPQRIELQITKPAQKRLKVTEDALAADKDSASADAFPAFHGYGVSGRASGQVVYVNYGRPDDFNALEKMGIDVKGKIVLVRYGELFRGLKVREAQKRGAIGILIYSDPADDGYARGDVYPVGPYRPPSAIQRGSVQFLSLGPGDPSTPDGPSIKGAKRLPIDAANGFPLAPPNDMGGSFGANSTAVTDWEKHTGLKRFDYYAAIPSLPISYEAAQPILDAMGGPNVPSGWQGGLPLAYHVGPGPVEVSFEVLMHYDVRPIWNVVAKIKGSVDPDRWILLGNHRDAWTYGAVDPSSGTAATLEMCRALGEAVKHGWKPKRTLVYASWDAEEYGLVGSTEWAEHHAKELDEKAVLLLNVDSAVGGPEIDLDGVPSMRDFVLECTRAVNEPVSGQPLFKLWTQKQRGTWANSGPVDLDPAIWNGKTGATASSESEPEHAGPRFFPQLTPLGSGSDYTVFLDHLGIPAVDVGFKGRYGVYHSIYDNFYWMEKFCDPEFIRHATAAKLYTLIAMRAAAADLVPLRFVPYAEALRDQVDDLRRMVERKARAAEPGAAKPPIRFEGLPELVRAVGDFQRQATQLDQLTTDLTAREALDTARLASMNDALQRVERAFMNPAGLPGRPWFKHTVYAPGLTTGYACWTMPGVRQAVIENKPEMLSEQLRALVTRLDAATYAMRSAASAGRELVAGQPGRAGRQAGGN